MRTSLRVLLVTAAAAASLPAHAGPPVAPSGASSWPQWLGPARDGKAHAPGTFAGRSVITLRVAWRRPMDAGLASLAIADGRLFTVASDGESDYALALSVQDGSEQWRAPLDPSVAVLDRGPVSTPAVHCA